MEDVWSDEDLRCFGRTLINTVEGRIGLGTATMRDGESIYLLKGGHAVYVLRKLDHDTILGSGIHSKEDLEGKPALLSLVGDAYIHGSMHGEAFTAPGRGPDQEFVFA